MAQEGGDTIYGSTLSLTPPMAPSTVTSGAATGLTTTQATLTGSLDPAGV